MSEKPKRRAMTEKQEAARKANLAKGRQKRAEMAKLKKEAPQYDIESESDSSTDSSSDSDAFILSKKRPTKRVKKSKSKDKKSQKVSDDYARKHEIDEIRSILIDVVKNQKKRQTKSRKRGGTQVVVNGVVPQNIPTVPSVPVKVNDSYLESLRKTIMM